MPQPSPEDIIAAFDEILDFVFGRSRGRDYPSKHDRTYAEQWLALGITYPIACSVFHHQMNRMHEAWLHNHNARDTKNIPQHMGIFDEHIKSAIERMKRGGESLSVSDVIDGQWRQRIRYWLKKPSMWNEIMRNHWGDPPDESTCRAPLYLLVELVPQHWKKTGQKKYIFVKA